MPHAEIVVCDAFRRAHTAGNGATETLGSPGFRPIFVSSRTICAGWAF